MGFQNIIKSRREHEKMSDWSAWGIVVLVIVSFLVYDILRRAKEKVYIKAYTEIKTEDGKKTFSDLESLGEFKGDIFNPKKRCYEFKFRRNFEYLSVFSNYTMTQLMEVHKIERVYLIYYSLNAYVFEKKLKEPYEKELGWSIQAYIYRILCFLFNMTPSGICCSLLICGTIFYFSIPEVSFAFLIGCALGVVISFLNYTLQKSDRIQETLLKKKTQLIETEFYMSPLESEREIIDIYQVKGTIQEKVMTSDNVLENKIVPIRDNDAKDYKTVTGYDELYELKTNPLVKIDEFKVTDMTSKKRTDQEMLNLRRSYLTRNRAFAEDNFRLKEENERLQSRIRSLEVQLQHVLETKDMEIKDALHRVTKERERLGNTLVDIYREIYGAEFVSENFEQTHARVMNAIEKTKEETKADKIEKLISAMERLFDLIGQKANVDVSELMKLLKIPEQGEKNGTKEAT